MTDWTSLATELLRDERTVLDECRAFERVEMPPATRARLITDRAGSRTVALVKDLSVTGIGFTVGLALTPGQFIVIELQRDARTQKLLARVVHCTPAGEGLFRAGAEFFDELPTTTESGPAPDDWLAYLP